MDVFEKCALCGADTEYEDEGNNIARLCPACEQIEVIVCGNDEELRERFANVEQDNRQDVADEWFQAACDYLTVNLPYGLGFKVCTNFLSWNGGKHYTENHIHADYFNAPVSQELETVLQGARDAAAAKAAECAETLSKISDEEFDA